MSSMKLAYLAVPEEQYKDAMKVLRTGRGDGSDGAMYTWTATFEDGKEVDLNVVDADPTYSEAVLFDEGGCELTYTEVSDDLLGDWWLYCQDEVYVLIAYRGTVPDVAMLSEDDECPICKNGTLEWSGEDLVCRGECGNTIVFTHGREGT